MARARLLRLSPSIGFEMAEIISFPASSPPQSAQANSEAWKLHGRDTPAGKALFALYGGDHGGKQAGSKFHQKNREEHEKKLSLGWTPPPIVAPKPMYQRPQISYPKFGGAKDAGESFNASRLQQIPRRRPGELILKEIREEQQRAKEALPPRPGGPVLDDAEKARLADIMRFRGKVPPVSSAEREEAAKHRGIRKDARTQREELQSMFQAVMQEVEERRTFLAEMQADGALKRDHVHQLQAEIKSRVEDMNRIDRMLRELDGE